MRKCKWYASAVVGVVLAGIGCVTGCGPTGPAEFEVTSLDIVPAEPVAGTPAERAVRQSSHAQATPGEFDRRDLKCYPTVR